jgi:enoyl-CoA hydratase/carnithine racemase
MSYENIIYTVENGIAKITLNRPEIRNALNEELMGEIIHALKKSNDDENVMVIILQGAGDKAFSAGGDLNKLRAKSRESTISIREYTNNYGKMLLALEAMGKPTVASVQGYALAGGCGLAVACDITIASEKAIFGVPEINIGFWGAMITAPIVRLVGIKKAMELFYTGNQISAVEAERIGLINRMVSHELLEQEVMALAGSIATKSPLAIRLGREMFRNSRDMEYVKSINYLREMATILAGSDDAYEGMSAFLEKREAQWKGK